MPTLVISLAVVEAMQVCLTPIPVTHRARAAAAAGRPDQVMPTLVIRQVRVAARAHRKSGRNCLQRRVELPSPIRRMFESD
jgi:hypothetical protein